MNRSLKLETIFFVFLFSFFFTLSVEANGSGSKRYRDSFSKAPEREEPVGEGKENEKDDRGTKSGKTGKKKKKDDDIVIPFGLEEKAPSKVFLEVEHGKIIASSYTGFTELEPAWGPIVWSPLADSWDRDSLDTSVQRAFVEGNGFIVVDENGALLSPDGSRTLIPEIGQDLGLGETGVLLIGFAGQLSIQGSVRTILSSAKILAPGAIAAATGRALSAATRLVPRIGPRVTPAAVISAPGFIILDTVTQSRGPYCQACGLPTEQWPPWYPRPDHTHPGVPPHPIIGPMPAPDPINPGVPPDTTTIGPRPLPDGDVDDLTRETGITTNTPNQIFDDQLGVFIGPGVYKWIGTSEVIHSEFEEHEDLMRELREQWDDILRIIKEIVENFETSETPEIDRSVLIVFIGNKISRQLGIKLTPAMIKRILAWIIDGHITGPPSLNGLPPWNGPGTGRSPRPRRFFPLLILSEDEHDRMKRFLGVDSRNPSLGDHLDRRGNRNAMKHHVSPIY